MIKDHIKKIDDSIKSYTKEFIFMMDEMLDKYHQDQWMVFDSVGITKDDYRKMVFTKPDFIRALNFYLKDRKIRTPNMETINIQEKEICH